MMKAFNVERRIWVECAVLAGASGLLAVAMSTLSARRKPIEPLATHKPEDIPAVLLEKPTPEDKVKSETACQALDQATA
jgi:hypothetical protein